MAQLQGGLPMSYRVTGNKPWITHAARADLMAMPVRTDPATELFRPVNFLAKKSRSDRC